MVLHKRSRKPARKLVPKKRNNNGQMVLRIPRMPVTFPDRVSIRMQYVQNNTASTTTTPFAQIFRGNSIFDPDLSGGGHEALGSDQWLAFYRSFVVIGSRITLQAIPVGGSGALTLSAQSGTTGTITPLVLAEKAYSKTVLLSAGSNPRKVSMYMNTAKVLGIDPVKVRTDDSFTALIGSTNPVEGFHWIWSYQDPDGATATTARIVTTIAYDVILFDRKRLVAS